MSKSKSRCKAYITNISRIAKYGSSLSSFDHIRPAELRTQSISIAGMRTNSIITAICLASLCQAQTQSADLNVTLSTAGARSCGQGTDGDGNAFTIHAQAVPSHQICLNLANKPTFDAIGLNGSHISLYDPADLNGFAFYGTEHYNPTVNYSQVFYKQQRNATHGVFGAIHFVIYDGFNCVIKGSSPPNDNNQGDPMVPFDWTCAEPEGKCSQGLLTRIRSISISPAIFNQSSTFSDTYYGHNSTSSSIGTGSHCRLAGMWVVSSGDARQSRSSVLNALAGAALMMFGMVILV